MQCNVYIPQGWQLMEEQDSVLFKTKPSLLHFHTLTANGTPEAGASDNTQSRQSPRCCIKCVSRTQQYLLHSVPIQVCMMYSIPHTHTHTHTQPTTYIQVPGVFPTTQGMKVLAWVVGQFVATSDAFLAQQCCMPVNKISYI